MLFRRHGYDPSTLDSRLRADLRISNGDGIAFGGMVGLGETFLPAFVLAAGLGELTAGLAGSVPLVMGGVLQLVSLSAVRQLRSHKRWVVVCAACQALAFLPLMIAAWRGSVTHVTVFLTAALYWGAGLATGPAWNTWMGTLVPPTVRASFFATRTRSQQVAVFCGFLAGGVALQLAAKNDRVMVTYAALFAAACVCRLVSASLLGCQSEPNPLPANMRRVPWREVLGHLSKQEGGRLLVYLVAVQAAVQMAGPFFTPFMFEKLRLSYGQFVLMISVAFLSKIIALPLWGRLGTRIGAARLLWIGGVGIVPLSGGWLISQHIAWLLVLQMVGGVVWAAYELAFFLLFFESIAEEERTSLLTIYNLFNTVAWVLGALLGGAVLWSFDATYQGYLVVFVSSSIARSLSLLLLWRLRMAPVPAGEMSVRSVAVRPGAAAMDAPVLSSLPDQVEDGFRSDDSDCDDEAHAVAMSGDSGRHD
ncbi:MAG: MFS transporter [Planctomycetales bacterium]|nr:MFS transporter [Planctomycetales bacterium]